MILAASLLMSLVAGSTPLSDAPFVTLCESDGSGIRTEVLRPASGPNGASIVFVHGGNWLDDEGLKEQYGLDDPVSPASRAQLTRLVSHGYVVFVPHYRGSPRFKFPVHIVELKCAMRALRTRAQELRIDPDRIGVMGASAGGHLAALLGLAGGSAGWDMGPYVGVSSRPQAVAVISAPVDLTGQIPSLAAPLLRTVFGTADPQSKALKNASPSAYVSKNAPPFFLVHGDTDPIVPYQLSEALHQSLRDAGADATFVLVHHAGHELRPVLGLTQTDPPAEDLTRALIAFFDQALAPAVARATTAIDEASLMHDLETLAADDMQGRKPGTPGHARARNYVAERFRESGIEPVNGGYLQSFTFTTRRAPKTAQRGTNIVGVIRGTARPDLAIVVTAHYDHVGVSNGRIFNGADDNASGTAALFALAKDFAARRPTHTLVFAALDAEEVGLRGARAFLDHPPVPLASIVLNVNLDMIGRDGRNTLYAVGTFQYPFLKPIIDRVARRAPVTLLAGHDGPGAPAQEDWTRESDHFAFHERGIPFVYFGVEDQEQHHKPTDDSATITRPFYANAVATVLDALRELDASAGAIAGKAGIR